MHALGRQILAEFHECGEHLNSPERIQEIMVAAANASEATIVETCFHHFSPHGVSGVIVIAESHIAIHTWPEYQYAAVDVFTCGETVDPWKITSSLETGFKAGKTSLTELKRGLFKTPVATEYALPKTS